MSGEQIRRIWSRGEIAAKYFRPTSVNAQFQDFRVKAVAHRQI